MGKFKSNEKFFLGSIISINFLILLIVFSFSFFIFANIDSTNIVKNDNWIQFEHKEFFLLTSFNKFDQKFYINQYGWILFVLYSISFVFVVYSLFAVKESSVIFGKSRIYLITIVSTLLIINSLLLIFLILLSPFYGSTDLNKSFLLPESRFIGIFQKNRNLTSSISDISNSKYGLFLQISENKFIMGSLYNIILGFCLMGAIVYGILIISWFLLLIVQQYHLLIDYYFEKRKRNKNNKSFNE